jgi:hypothetical protein
VPLAEKGLGLEPLVQVLFMYFLPSEFLVFSSVWQHPLVGEVNERKYTILGIADVVLQFGP